MCTDNRLRKKQRNESGNELSPFESFFPVAVKIFITTKATTRKASFANITLRC